MSATAHGQVAPLQVLQYIRMGGSVDRFLHNPECPISVKAHVAEAISTYAGDHADFARHVTDVIAKDQAKLAFDMWRHNKQRNVDVAKVQVIDLPSESSTTPNATVADQSKIGKIVGAPVLSVSKTGKSVGLRPKTLAASVLQVDGKDSKDSKSAPQVDGNDGKDSNSVVLQVDGTNNKNSKVNTYEFHPLESIHALLRHYCSKFFPVQWGVSLDDTVKTMLQSSKELASLDKRLLTQFHLNRLQLAVSIPETGFDGTNSAFKITSYYEELIEYQECATGLAFVRNIHGEAYKDSLMIVEFDPVKRTPATFTRFVFGKQDPQEPYRLNNWLSHSVSDLGYSDHTQYCMKLLPKSRFRIKITD